MCLFIHSFVFSVPADLCGCWRRLQQGKGQYSLQQHTMHVICKDCLNILCVCVCVFFMFHRIMWWPWAQRAGFTSLTWRLPPLTRPIHPASMNSRCPTTRSPSSPNIFLQTPKSSSSVISVKSASPLQFTECASCGSNSTVSVCRVDGDGRCELVVGYTDRVVRAFRWEEPSDGSDVGSGQLVLLKKWLLEGQVALEISSSKQNWKLFSLVHRCVINQRIYQPKLNSELNVLHAFYIRWHIYHYWNIFDLL